MSEKNKATARCAGCGKRMMLSHLFIMFDRHNPEAGEVLVCEDCLGADEEPMEDQRWSCSPCVATTN